MKDQFLKLAKVKNEAEFYKKFPTEEAFMAKYGKQVKKLNLGGAMATMNKLAGSNAFATGVQSLGDVIGGIQQMKDEKQQMLKAQQMQGVSNVALQASMTKPEQVERKYARPEDSVNTGQEFFPIYGVGTNVLAARNGTEIANTYAPNTIYTDLEQAQNGINFPTNPDFMKQGKNKDVSDIYSFAEQGGGDALAQVTAGLGSPKGYGVSGAGKVGGGIGATAGMLIGGPVGSMLGKFAGQTIGNLVDRKAEKTEKANEATRKNTEMMALNQGAQSLQRQNYSYMEDGGFVNPQLATSLEDIPLTRLFAPDPYMDTLRTGGNIRQNNMAFGGDLQVYRGEAEPMSYNPYLESETIMFRGPSHDDGGMPITFGENPVEVEGGEPAIKLRNGSDGSSNLTVYGNLKIPKYGAAMMGDVKAAGTKFKNYISDLSKTEQKQNKLMDKSVTALDELQNINNPYDKLKFNSFDSNMIGANMKLKDIADKKIKAASLQEAINKTAEEYKLNADDLAKGKVKQAKKGASIPKYQNSGDPIQYTKKSSTPGMLDYTPVGARDTPQYFTNVGNYEKEWLPFVDQVVKDEKSLDYIINNLSNYSGQDAEDVINLFKGKTKQEQAQLIDKLGKDRKIGPVHDSLMKLYDLKERRRASEAELEKLPVPRAPKMFASPDLPGPTIPERKKPGDTKEEKFDWMNIANQILPYVRPTDAEQLDPRQLAGEMYALSTNQVMPVDAQLFQPQLSVPYDISLQDQLNANQSDYRAAQRMMGYNPAAQSSLNSQKYKANQQVLGEQFRMNQGMKDQVYRENRALLNEANLRNLQTLDQQFIRQQEALSNTKATTQAALNSIASKYAQNQLENRTLQTYENLYNYRFDPRFRATNMNPLAQFTTQLSGAPVEGENAISREITRQVKERLDAAGMPAGKTITTQTKEKERNGAIVSAFKNYK